MVGHGALSDAFASANAKRTQSERQKIAPEFLILRGPQKRGKAQVAIRPVLNEEEQQQQEERSSKDGNEPAGMGKVFRAFGSMLNRVADKVAGAGGASHCPRLGAGERAVKLNSLLTYIHLHWREIVEKLFDD